MDCNGLINPLFVRLLCILWRFVWRPGCFLCWFAFPQGGSTLENPPGCLDRSHASQDVKCVVRVGQHLTWKWLEQYYLLRLLSAPLHFYASLSRAVFWSKPYVAAVGTELHQLHHFGFLHIFLKSVSFATYQLGLDGTQFFLEVSGFPKQLRASVISHAKSNSGPSFQSQLESM